MLGNIVRKIFGTASEREMKKLQPLVDEINEKAAQLQKLSDEELKAKTQEFRDIIAERTLDIRNEIEAVESEIQSAKDPDERSNLMDRKEHLEEELYKREQEILNDIMTDAYAVVKDACRRLVGQEFVITGHRSKWNMVPFDVQLIGAIVLHQGKIAEMKTGEGKTLVATMPLYLNALVGKGAHLVTVNDYLAKRDSQWMGIIYKYLGLTVDCLQGSMEAGSPERKNAYAADITYGTNNEFGFDYLRDNMAISADDRVQRGFYYAIVDEVDSVLIDEARTPLIISGPVQSTIGEKYRKWSGPVENVVHMQLAMSNSMLSKAEKLLKEEGKEREAAMALLMVRRSTPRHKRYLKLLKERPDLEKLILKVEGELMRDKELHDVIDSKLYFVKEERENSINLTDKGRETLAPKSPEIFVLPDMGRGIAEIDENPGLTASDKADAKQKLYATYADRSETMHSITQLLKAYTLFEKDVDYVLQNQKVIIVDEFTGRLMPGRRFSDGLHQALEAKERVKVEQETQTFATITLQNYFRMYKKLAGMTGTAATEAEEFYQIYKLDVVEIPTNRPVRRMDYDDRIYMTLREKYNAIIDEIERLHKRGQPVLVGTVSVDVSETLSRMLKRRGISHSVLNAKHHQKEAEVVAQAGQPEAVTIATNMAGRGTDIKLGEGVVKCADGCKLLSDLPDDTPTPVGTLGDCRKDTPCGLSIIGSERHESRRIDNQLRGRAGRQGDPGRSRFLLSLQDNLIRLYAGGDRIASVMSKLKVPEGEPIEHGLISKSIERAQKRVESQNFAIRKHLIEYDDVMNQQRTVIYSMRNEVLTAQDLTYKYRELLEDYTDDLVDEYVNERVPPEEWDWDELSEQFSRVFVAEFPKLDAESLEGMNSLRDILIEAGNNAVEFKRALLGDETLHRLMSYALLATIDKAWMEHLHTMDTLKEGVSLRSYAQKDPLVEYKREGYSAFVEMLTELRKDVLIRFFHTQVEAPKVPYIDISSRARQEHKSVSGFDASVARQGQQQDGNVATRAPSRVKVKPIIKTKKKIGRNDPCPCGSGKKYKNCCGKNA